MTKVRKLAIPLFMAFLAGACGSSHAVGRVTFQSPASPAISSPSGATTPSAPAGCSSTNRCLALVTLSGSDAIVVRDVSDISHPKTLSNLGPIAAPIFISAAELSYVQNNRLVRAPLAGSPATVVVNDQLTGSLAWSPDGAAVAYIVQTGTTLTVHELSGGADRIVGSIPAPGVGGCELIAGCDLPNWLDLSLAFSADGTSISLIVDSFGVNVFRVWSSNGRLLGSGDSKGQTMSVWLGNSLYFRDGNGVEVWRDGVVSAFLPGVAWIEPRPSPGGGQIVYSARDSSGWAHVYLVDTTTRKVSELKSGRTNAAFLSARYVWYQGERACQPDDGCGDTPPIHPHSGKAYVYDLQDGTETESVITSVSDVWPHPA